MAKDLIHEVVKTAFIKDGWTISNDPFNVKLLRDFTFFEIDLAAHKIPKDSLPIFIAIEIKSLAGASTINAFHTILGQFLNYKRALEDRALNNELFIAVSIKEWRELSGYEFVQRQIGYYSLKFVVIDIKQKQVMQWIR